MIKFTIKRENGEIEIVENDKFDSYIHPVMFEKIKEATAKAGRGEVLSWEKADGNKAVESDYDKKRRIAGYCHKCQTFCYGSC